MTRFMLFVMCVLMCAPLVVPVRAEDPPKKLTAEERTELETKRKEQNTAGIKAYQTGQYSDAQKEWAAALDVARRLYPKGEFPDGHVDLAQSLNNLAVLCQNRGKLAEAEALYLEAVEMFQRLTGDHPAQVLRLNSLASLCLTQGKQTAAEPFLRRALDMTKRLYKSDHPSVAVRLNNLAFLYHSQGKLTNAEPLYKEALDMAKRLHKGDHPDIALGLNNLAGLHKAQGKLSEAEPLYKDALEMRKRLHKGDHPDVAMSLNNLASLYQTQGQLDAAEPLFKDALDMFKRVFKGDHPFVAASLSNLAGLYWVRGKRTETEPLFKEALEMRKRVFKGEHPDIAFELNNLAGQYREQGRLADAGVLYKDALDMFRRVYQGDHPVIVASLNNLAGQYREQGRLADAGVLYKDALDMSWRLIAAFARHKSEGEVLTLTASLPRSRDGFLSLVRARANEGGYAPATAYPAVWAAKGAVARVYEQRQLRARAATDPVLTKGLADLADARRRRAELLLAPATTDPGTLRKREEDLKTLDDAIRELNEKLPQLLPAVARADKLNDATSAELQKAMPADAALVDFVHYTFFEFDDTRPVGQKERQTRRYLAFVVTADKVAWVDLDTAAKIEPAIDAWREAVVGGKDVPAALPAKVRELVWDKVRKELPAKVTTVYVCPDAALCRVPWAALPGDKPGTILLEDFAVATVPHAPFLLDKLWKPDPLKNPPTGALVVGGVKYDADVHHPAPGAGAEPLVKPGAKLGWAFLPGTAAEATGVFGAATAKKLAVTALRDEKATSAAVLAALPKAKYAHFATHGFFADPSFRSAFQLDEKDFEQRNGERVGRAANSPLVMTGLVFAGANNPKTPGRGIVTGEALVDLDLSGLDLAVLSACETGLGDQGNAGGGEGTFGLQRAFHYAGAKNVVCSLWKVPDQSTAALMALFYRNLWDKNLAPMEALRQAQLEIYRDPAKIPELAKGFRGKFEEVPGMGAEVNIKPNKDGKAHPVLWAAFTLSGPGR